MKTPYKNYLLRQMGIKESQVPPSIVERNAFPGIDPDELEMGAEDEKDEHHMSDEKAAQTAAQHLDQPNQGHYYTGMEKAKKAGMLRDALAGGALSPTAIPTPVIAVAIRGSNTGGLPSGADQTGISPNTPTGRLGGYEPIPTAKDNSELVNKTPKNTTIDSTTPIASNGGDVQTDPHPHQVQHSQGEPPQNVTGASTDGDTALTLKSAMPKEKSVDIDVAQECNTCGCGDPNDKHDNDMNGEETMEDNDKAKQGLNEGKHKAGCTCGFCANKGKMGKKKEDGDDKSDSDDKKEKKDDTSFAGLIKGKSKNKAKKDDEKKEKSDTKKLNEIKSSLQEKAIAGKMDKRETKVFNLIQEVLKKRGAK